MNRCIAISVVSVAVLWTAACATPPTPGQTVQQPVRISGSGGSTALTLTETAEGHVYRMGHPMDRVWEVLPAVYDSIGVPVTIRNAAMRTIGNDAARLRRSLNGVPMRRYLNCGRTQVGDNADSYELSVSVMTQLSPGDDGFTNVVTVVQANARNVQFAADWIRCTSTGELEALIARVALAKLRG